MRGITTAILGLAGALACVPLLAKSETAKITITSPALHSTVEITDPQVRAFSVWSGPGVRVDGVEQMEGFIINWRQGVVKELPSGLRHVEVAFYGDASDQPVYTVFYDYNPVSGEGYVYLPGKNDEGYTRNTAAVLHGTEWEGHWFRATAAWETFVRPLIARARSVSLNSRVMF